MVLLQTIETEPGFVTVVINKLAKTLMPKLDLTAEMQPKLLAGKAEAIAGITIIL